MKIILIDSPDLKESIAEQIQGFLSGFSGEWEFIVGNGNPKFGDYYQDNDFETKTTIRYSAEINSFFEQPLKIERWSSIFDRILDYRTKESINHDDFLLMYSSSLNEFNWFGMFDPYRRLPNGFVQGDYWNEFVESEAIYPILYETVAIPLQWRMFKDAENVSEVTHSKPIGCINDLCVDKREIILKLQTGNICQTCYNKALEKGVSEQELDQIDKILDAIRLRFREFNQRRNKRDPYPVNVCNAGRKIYIGDSELRLRPLDKALYLFFLNTDEEHRTADLVDFERELLKYYKPLYNGSERDEMIRNAGRLARNEDGLTNQAVSRINRALGDLVLAEHFDYYKILTDSNGFKKVNAQMIEK
jgi:hypothetical protein